MAMTLKSKTLKTPKSKPKAGSVAKTDPVQSPRERHKEAGRRDKFPKRPRRGTRPFETTMDF